MKLTLSILALSVFAFGCGSSNSGPRGAAWCDTKYKVSTFEVKDATKTKLEEDTELSLNVGEYKLRELDVFIVDSNRDIRTHMAYSIDEEGEMTSAKVKCLASDTGQINPGMDNYIYELDVFSKMIVDESGKTLLGNGTAKIEFKDRADETFLKGDFVADDAAPVEKKLKDSFKTGFSEREQYFFAYSNTYELQNKLARPGIRVESRQVWKKSE